MKQEFHTFNDDMKSAISASMEDYLEMIYRLSNTTQYTRLSSIASALNISPSAASEMIKKMADKKLLIYQNGIIVLTDNGKQKGALLLKRHHIIEQFLKIIGLKQTLIFKETEKIEHTISHATLICIENFIKKQHDKEKD